MSWYIWYSLAAVTSAVIGVHWDISWHRSIDRDTFWTPAHVAIYLRGVLSGIVEWVLIVATTFGTQPREAWAVGGGGNCTGSYTFEQLLAWCIRGPDYDPEGFMRSWDSGLSRHHFSLRVPGVSAFTLPLVLRNAAAVDPKRLEALVVALRDENRLSSALNKLAALRLKHHPDSR